MNELEKANVSFNISILLAYICVWIYILWRSRMYNMEQFRKSNVLVGFSLILMLTEVASDCAMLNDCNGHGTCNLATSTCSCYEGWGASTDVTLYRAPDCSARSCPSFKAWADVPSAYNVAHAVAECSNRGTCNRVTGVCTCFDGFTGSACEKSRCPNDCSGHGICTSIKQMARMSNALPLAPDTYYEGYDDTTTWDEDMSFGCVCDSSWAVGLGNGETQQSEWFGPDCSMRHCPSGNDPYTLVNETDCYNITAPNSIYAGESGNLCHVDCSNRGLCNYKTGLCQCFNGLYGAACDDIDPQATYIYWNKGRQELDFQQYNHAQEQVL